MRTNISIKYPDPTNNEGVPTARTKPIWQLRRTVLACLLLEDSFYEDGVTIAERIKTLVHICDPVDVERLAIDAREKQHLRHAPLLLVRELARHPAMPKIADVLCRVIQRADELSEFLAIYWKDGKQPLSAQVKKGLARAFTKFDEYALAKYDRAGAVKLRDVLFMCHAKPADVPQGQLNKWNKVARSVYGDKEDTSEYVLTAGEILFKKLVDGKLESPDTWEVALSSGADKAETFTRLLNERKLGALALLRNLRNMEQAGVDKELVKTVLLDQAPKSKALPFRYIAAARACPSWEPMIDEAMQASMACMEKMTGRTIILIDVSPSMHQKLSEKSDLTRIDAACALAILVRGVCDNARVFAFSTVIGEAPPRSGMALADAIKRAVPAHMTLLGYAIQCINAIGYDRLIVVTDEESQDQVGGPIENTKAYMINVSTGQHGVGYGDWTKITGFSESVITYIQECEKLSIAP